MILHNYNDAVKRSFVCVPFIKMRLVADSLLLSIPVWFIVPVSSGDPPTEEEKAKKEAGKPQVDEIVPVYRRDCHEEVYAGSHQYPGRGVYLLKFDNSYSLWRSKSVYYRVYYTR